MADTGAIGGVLTDVALGYLEGLLKPSRADLDAERALKLQRAELENRKLEEDAALARARVAATGKIKGRIISNKHGVWEYDPDTGFRSLYEAPPTEASRPDDIVKFRALKVMEQLRGKPFHEFGYEDFNDERVKGIMFDVYKMRPEIVTGPAGPNTRGDIYGAPRSPAAPAAAPAAAPSPAATTPTAPPPAAPVPPTAARPAGPRPPSVTTGKKPAVGPQATGVWMDQYDKLTPAELAEEKTLLDNMPPSPIVDAKKNALAQVLAKRQAGETPAQGAVTPATPPATAVSSAQPPPKSLPGESPAVAPQADPGGARVVSPRIVSPEQLRKQGRDARDQEIQEENVLRSRAADQRAALQLRLQQEGHSLAVQEARLRELDRQEDNRRGDAQLRLSETRTNAYLKELEDANKRKDDAAAFRVTQNVMRETREARGMIQGVDETVALIQEMRRYISPETVGVKGAVRGAWQSVWGQLTDSAANKPLQGNAATVQRLAMETAGRYAQEAEKFGGTWQLEENERARAEGRAPSQIYIPDYSRYGYDPRMRFIDFLKEVIAYAHARAMNGPGRLTDQDLNRAQKSLGIDGWINSAADMQTSIGYVEKQLTAKKARAQAYAASVEKTLRKHRPGAVEAGGEDVTPPPEE